MSAPHSIGRHRYGVANVLSTISGSSCSCATDATASMSSTLPAGLPIVSPKNALVFGADAPPPRVGIVGIDPRQLDAHLAQQMLELVDRPAVERRGRDDVVARLQQREQRRGLRGDPAGERHRAGAALEVRHPLLEHGDGRVHDPRVRVAVLLQVEVGRRRLGVFEHVAGGLEDRHRAGAGVRVGPLPGVELARLEAEGAGLLARRRLRSFASVMRLSSEEATDDRRLPRFLEQEAVVAVRRVDHMALDRLAERRSAASISRDPTAGTASRS